MDEHDPITIERLFSLGDYKNLKVNITQTGLSTKEKSIIMLNNVCDAYTQLYIHQIVNAEINAEEWVDYWLEKLETLNKIRAKYMMIMEEED